LFFLQKTQNAFFNADSPLYASSKYAFALVHHIKWYDNAFFRKNNFSSGNNLPLHSSPLFEKERGNFEEILGE